MNLAELKALAERATAGPWSGSALTTGVAGDQTNDGWTVVASIPCPKSPWKSARHKQWQADATFIAAARQAVPELIAEVERLRGELDFIASMSTDRDASVRARAALKQEPTP